MKVIKVKNYEELSRTAATIMQALSYPNQTASLVLLPVLTGWNL